MAVEIVGKFRKGDRVVVVATEEDPDYWCAGCHGTVRGIFPMGNRPPIYLVKLDDSPSPMIKDSWIYESELEKEPEEK